MLAMRCNESFNVVASDAKQSTARQIQIGVNFFVASLLAMTVLYSSSDISAALPPAAAVLIVTVCSVAKRAR